MLKKTKFILHLFVLFVLLQQAVAENINVQFHSNKAEYICGEPVLLKTTVSNPSGEDFKGKSPGYGWGKDFGFTMYIALGDEEFENMLSVEAKVRLGVSTPPMQWNLFNDLHWLPRNLSAGQQVQRFDMLIIPKPGNYKLKAVLKEPKKKGGKTYASKPIEFRVVPIKEKYDSISKLGKQDFLINLGSSIYYAHYVERLWGGYPPGESLHPEKFEQVAPVIRENYKDSVFREYVMYADIMTHYRPDRSTHELIKGRREFAERFVKEYPKSWLLPEVYRKLFWTYVAEKDKEKAQEIRKKALQVAPNASVLRFVKEKIERTK